MIMKVYVVFFTNYVHETKTDSFLYMRTQKEN